MISKQEAIKKWADNEWKTIIKWLWVKYSMEAVWKPLEKYYDLGNENENNKFFFDKQMANKFNKWLLKRWMKWE